MGDSPGLLGDAQQKHLEILTELSLLNTSGSSSTPRIVVLRGQSGVGKTRIVRELYENLVVQQDAPSYWPSVRAQESPDFDSFDPFAFRKRIGPKVDRFLWKPEALPSFGWWSVSCQRSNENGFAESLANLERQLNTHMVPLSLAWAQRVGAWGQFKSSVKAGWQERLQEAMQEGATEAITTVLSQFGATFPGAGLAIEYASTGIRALARRAQRKKSLLSEEELSAASAVPLIAEQLKRFAGIGFPMIVAIEDLQWADQQLIDLLHALLLDERAVPGLTVIATAWPQAKAENPYSNLVERLEKSNLIRFLDLDGIEPEALARIVLESAPKTDPETLAAITSRWPNPYALQLALADRRLRGRIVDARYDVTQSELNHLPVTIRDLYRLRWRELPQMERAVLAVGVAGGIRDQVTQNVSFVDEITAKVIELSKVGHMLIPFTAQQSELLSALDRTAEPLRWTRATPDRIRTFIEPDAASAARDELSQSEITAIQTSVRAVAEMMLRSDSNPEIAATYLQCLEPVLDEAVALNARLAVAGTLLDAGRFREAASMFEAIPSSRQSGDDAVLAKSEIGGLFLAGRALLRASQLKESVSVFRHATEVALQSGKFTPSSFPGTLAAMWVTAFLSESVSQEPLVRALRQVNNAIAGPSIAVREHGTETWTNLLDGSTVTVLVKNLASDLDVRIGYDNVSGKVQNNVILQACFDRGAQYIGGSSYLKNASNPTGFGTKVHSEAITTTVGLNIGNYTPNSNAFVYFVVNVKDPTALHHVIATSNTDHGNNITIAEFSLGQEINDSDGAPPAARFPRAGYSPDRPVFDVKGDHYPISPTFNAIYNNPNYGDERAFALVKEADITAAGGWKNECEVAPGQRYLMRIYGNNAASDAAGIAAVNARIMATIPNGPGTSHKLWGFVKADNAVPERVAASIVLYARQPVVLSYVAGSARLYNNGAPSEGFPLSDQIVTNQGAIIGHEQLDGIVPPGCKYSCIATLLFTVDAVG